ncbi:hypothetical protein [Chroococcidiopsis sp. TS-821]|uniref:hypothetical protein n=1 Tax=Chroococcidiopsis sp. TS-821 TaxID=1378066 RepID=UPI000CEF4D74|nr:hypothetical protein [Chroococcidiopsis sp. TS-821]PPS45191.1 hypothetical protein B1A85_02715 [Chroococcidiopsis sp. TS-821]
MENFISTLPPILLFSIFLFVVLPSFAAIFLRSTLYNKLVFLESRVRRLINRTQRGQQPDIIKELERRFKEASTDLDRVNTAALIEQIYSQQKIGLFSYDQIEYFCRILPNLLLAFGLLGTFLGITLNLSQLSQTITNNTVVSKNIDSLLEQLQQPLQAMSIAFSTSLTAILFSASITAFNLIKNTSVAKYKLIISIEDYLDNIYQSEIQGNHRLDKAVDRLVFEFKDFLGRFGITVRDAVESSLGAKIQEIVDVNKQANELACRVYRGFQESSGTFAKSVDDLQTATTTFVQTAQIFEGSNFAQTLASAAKDLYVIQNKFNHSTEVLCESVSTIETAVVESINTNNKLLDLCRKIDNYNQSAIQTLELHQNNQQSLSEIIPQLYEGGAKLQSAIEVLDILQQKNLDKADSFERVEIELKTLADTLNKYNQVVAVGLKNLSDRLIAGLDAQSSNQQQQMQIIVENLTHCTKHLSDTKHESYRLNKLLEKQLIVDKSRKQHSLR